MSPWVEFAIASVVGAALNAALYWLGRRAGIECEHEKWRKATRAFRAQEREREKVAMAEAERFARGIQQMADDAIAGRATPVCAEGTCADCDRLRAAQKTRWS